MHEWPSRPLWYSKLSLAVTHFPQQLVISVWITSKPLISLLIGLYFSTTFLSNVSPDSLVLLWTLHPELFLYLHFSNSASPFLSNVKVWKQKGEEYRVTGYGGWSWISKTYVQQFVPKLPGNTNANYRKELEGLERNTLGLKLWFLVIWNFGFNELSLSIDMSVDVLTHV